MANQSRLMNAYRELRAGKLSRRGFLQRAAALGVATPVALGLLRLSDVAAQDATPATTAALAAPESGTADQTRGAGGELRILQ